MWTELSILKKKCLKNTLWRYFNWFSIWFQVVWEIFYLVWEVHPSRRVEEVDRTRTEEMIGGVGAVWGGSIKKSLKLKGKKLWLALSDLTVTRDAQTDKLICWGRFFCVYSKLINTNEKYSFIIILLNQNIFILLLT